MGLKKFNSESEKPEFMAKANPFAPHSWQILQYKNGKKDYEPVGEYILIDTGEDIDITEKKLINLVRLLNGKRDLLDLGNLTKKRVLFNIVPRTSETDPTKIIFRDHDGKGVSVENAVLTLEKGVLNESQ